MEVKIHTDCNTLPEDIESGSWQLYGNAFTTKATSYDLKTQNQVFGSFVETGVHERSNYHLKTQNQVFGGFVKTGGYDQIDVDLSEGISSGC